MISKIKILFISWDGPQTNYMEGLFFPIFSEIQRHSNYIFHVLQFTFADEYKLATIREAAENLNIIYKSEKIHRKPVATIGSIITVLAGSKKISHYVKNHKIDIVMPRTTFPAMMMNKLGVYNYKVIFDADGFPTDERVDFAGLSATSMIYRFLKTQEQKIVRNADRVMVRSQKSIDVHIKEVGAEYLDKFHIVSNGRDPDHFKPNSEQREIIRKQLGIKTDAILWVYCGSLGPQYCWTEMISIFSKFHSTHEDSKFLILTGNEELAKNNLPEDLINSFIIMKVPFEKVPNYLNAGDIAFSLRKPTFSTQGVAPIKLGEYLLTGISTVASKGIGDTEVLVSNIPGVFLYDHDDEHSMDKVVEFAESLSIHTETLRTVGLKHFSQKNSALSYIKALENL